MECKICNQKFKGKIGLNTHIRTHKIELLEYHIKYESFKIPKCECGKNRKKNKIEFRFNSTCGDIDCVKKTLREKRISWIKENPEKTAWRLSNMSYPEKIFIKKCEELKLNENHLIIREKSVFPYFIDFAFEHEKVAVEIDGSQHNLEERKKSDAEKDKMLINLGWRVIRFSAKDIQININLCIEKLYKFIGSSTIHEVVGIFAYKDYKQETKKETLITKKVSNKEQERIENLGLTNEEIKRALNQRRIKSPPYDSLIQEIKELGYSAVGRKYEVSDNAVRKWIKTYEKYNI